ncbi:MAG: hypothetical protein C0594_16755 [Marinilabiliales bacterium]|nr:MAG: hypothetical protein C0594_16755 [Marinilabiliales bacterium]
MGWFWNSYALDITGPAWNYILFRGLFTGYKKNRWTRFFRPVTTFVVFLIVSFSIEILQYFEVYKSTFDPYDLLSYISLLIPIFILDLLQQKKSRQD